MFADACRIISILAVIWFQNKGLALVLFILLPFLFWFTRYVQKNMLAAQVENRRASAVLPVMCRKPCIISVRFITFPKKIIWKNDMTNISSKAIMPWKRPTFTMRSIHRSF